MNIGLLYDLLQPSTEKTFESFVDKGHSDKMLLDPNFFENLLVHASERGHELMLLSLFQEGVTFEKTSNLNKALFRACS